MEKKRLSILAAVVALAVLVAACQGAPATTVVLDNAYPTSSPSPLVVYDAYWQAVSFAGSPLVPGASSAPQPTVPASANTAYVVVAPGWDPSSVAPPKSFVVLESREGYSVGLGDSLQIAVDDNSFIGNCAAGSHLTATEATFITRYVFACDFATMSYDPATCTVTPIADTGACDGGD
jgi:hypothetical protein